MNVTDRRACGGFTMVELVLVIMIAGVLAAVAVPRMVDRSAFQTRGGASEVRTALRYAQRLAMAKNREVCVTTTASDLTLTFNPLPGIVCSQAVIRPSDGGAYVVTLPAGITLTPGVSFRFDGQGRPSPNAAVNLTVGGTIPVTVTRETGYVQ
jgi:MSHA pilin protein MshC